LHNALEAVGDHLLICRPVGQVALLKGTARSLANLGVRILPDNDDSHVARANAIEGTKYVSAGRRHLNRLVLPSGENRLCFAKRQILFHSGKIRLYPVEDRIPLG